MNPRLGSEASSRVYSLPPDLIEMVSHVLLRAGWCPGGGLVRRTIALRVEAENRTHAFNVARSRAAVARTIAAAAQSKADAAAAELARCEDVATLAAANAAQCTVMATSALQLLEQARQPARKLVEATALAKRLRAEATEATKACGDLAARSITAEYSPSTEASVQVAVEKAADAQTAAATAEARATSLADEARIAEPALRQAEHAAQMAVTDAGQSADVLVASKQRLQEMRQPMVEALEAQAQAAAAEVVAIEAERCLQVCTTAAAAARQAEIVEHIAARSRALCKENRAVLAVAELDMESAGWLPIDDEQGMYYYNARTRRRTRAKPQVLQEVCKARESVRILQKARLVQILPEIGLEKLGSVAAVAGKTSDPEEQFQPTQVQLDTVDPSTLRHQRSGQRRARPQQEDASASEEPDEDSPPGTPPSESKHSSPSSCLSTTTPWFGGFMGVLWDGPLPPLFVRHAVAQHMTHDDAPAGEVAQLGPRMSSSSASSLYSLSSSASPGRSSCDGDHRRVRRGGQLASNLQSALVRNEQLAVAAAAARKKQVELLTPSVLGQRMEWLEWSGWSLKQGRPSPPPGGGHCNSASCGECANRRTSWHNRPPSTRSSNCGEMTSLDLCHVD